MSKLEKLWFIGWYVSWVIVLTAALGYCPAITFHWICVNLSLSEL